MSSRYDPFGAVSMVGSRVLDYARNTPIGEVIGVADDPLRSGQRYGSYDSGVYEGDVGYAGPTRGVGSPFGTEAVQQQGQPSMFGDMGERPLPPGVGRTREVLQPGDPGYIEYTSRQEMYDKFRPEIEAVTVSDEDWLNMSEEERQANYEARMALLPRAYAMGGGAGSGDAFSPFGDVSLAGTDPDEVYASLLEKKEAGEIDDIDFERYTDDLRRGAQVELDAQRDMLLGAGFTEQELQDAGYYGTEFASLKSGFDAPDPEDYLGGSRSRLYQEDLAAFELGQADPFRATVEDISLADERQLVKTYDLYDNRILDNYNSVFGELDRLRGVGDAEFSTAYSQLGNNQQNAYLYHAYDNGNIDREEYRALVTRNLLEDGVPLFMTDKGELAKGYKYGQYQLVYFGDEADKKRAPGTVKDSAGAMKKGGASDEQIDRRKTVHDLEVGNVYFGPPQRAEKRPEKSIWSRVKAPVLNYLTGGLYSASRDPEQFLIDTFGSSIIDAAFASFDAALPEMPPEVEAGVKRTVVKLAEGENFDDALQSGVGKWAEEAGVGDEFRNTLEQLGRDFDDEYLQPLKDMLPEFETFDTPEEIKAIEDTVRDVGSAVEDAAEATGLKGVVEDVGSFIDDAFLQPLKDGLLAGVGGVAVPSPTRTTDSLFSDELFQFTPVEFIEDVGRTQPRKPVVQEEQIVNIFDNPFESDFNRKV